jgi:hypothetical protein
MQLEMQAVHAQLNTNAVATKDLTLVALVPKWAGMSKTISLQEFFESTENASRVCCWTQEDKVHTATLKLMERVRTFYNATSELHTKDITWSTFKSILQRRFKDARTDQFNFSPVTNGEATQT